MAKVFLDISMSLDGFVAAANQTAEAPLGDGGELLHEWAFAEDELDREILTDGVGGSGAVICGNRTYRDSLPWWGADGPTGSTRLPVFVLCGEAPPRAPDGGVYSFVTAGPEAALEAAREAAGEKNVTVMGGAETARTFLAAGLLDELSIHVAPVLFGGGTRLFDGLDPLGLESLSCVHTPTATHLRFEVTA
jgi:dihydrofolate reductase